MFGLNKKEKKKPVEKHKKITRAEEIAKKYGELSNCYKVISETQLTDDDCIYRRRYAGVWGVLEHKIKDAGIDVEDIYHYVAKLARKRKAALECELAKLDD